MGSLPISESSERVSGEGGPHWTLRDAVPGAIIRHPGGRTIDESEHVWLAWMSHNLSDVHGNADQAARSAWGEPLVLGMLTAAIVIGLAEPAMGPPDTAAAALGRGWRSITLERTVVAGATITAESHIARVRPFEEGTSAEVRRTIIGRDQRGRVVVRIDETRMMHTWDGHEGRPDDGSIGAEAASRRAQANDG